MGKFRKIFWEKKGFLVGGMWGIMQFRSANQFNRNGERGWVIDVLLKKTRSLTFENWICIYCILIELRLSILLRPEVSS